MANVKYAGMEAINRIADYVNAKLTFVSTMPESPDIDTMVLYVGADTSAYKQGGVYRYDGTNWVLINLVKAIELTQEEYNALPLAVQCNGTIYFVTNANVEGSIITGYYNSTDGKFYIESTFETPMADNVNVIYIDAPTNITYIYDLTNDKYVQVGGGGSGTVIKYVSTLPVTGIEDIIYGYNSITSYNKVTAEGFLDTDDNFIKNGNVYTAKNGIVIEASADGTNYNTFTSLEYNQNNSEFILTYGDSTSEVIAVGGTFYWKVYTKIYYAGNASEQNLTLLASSSGGSEISYTAGDGIKIENHEISVTEDRPAIFVGTTQKWDALTAAEKAQYKVVNLTNDAVGGDMVVVDTVEDGNFNPVTSNAVYDELGNYISTETIALRSDVNVIATKRNSVITLVFYGSVFSGVYDDNIGGMVLGILPQKYRTGFSTVNAVVARSGAAVATATYYAEYWLAINIYGEVILVGKKSDFTNIKYWNATVTYIQTK